MFCDCDPPSFSLSFSLTLCSLPVFLCLSSFIFLSSHPHFLLQQREKRWSISSAGGEKNSSSVSRKSWWGEIEKARGSEGRLFRVERSRGREMEGKGNTQEQHNRVSFLLGIKSGSSSALTTLLLDKMFLLQRLACKLDARLCFLYPFCLLSLLHWVNYNQAAIAPLWMETCLHKPTNSTRGCEWEPKEKTFCPAWKYCYNVHVWV